MVVWWSEWINTMRRWWASRWVYWCRQTTGCSREQDGHWCSRVCKGKKVLSFCLNYTVQFYGNKLTTTQEKEDSVVLSQLFESSRSNNLFGTKEMLCPIAVFPMVLLKKHWSKDGSFQHVVAPSKKWNTIIIMSKPRICKDFVSLIGVTVQMQKALPPASWLHCRYGRCLHKQIVKYSVDGLVSS